jgi:hypothetical protein
MKFVMVISCLILIFSTVTQITQEMGMHTFDSIRSTHGLLIFSITSLIWYLGALKGMIQNKDKDKN